MTKLVSLRQPIDITVTMRDPSVPVKATTVAYSPPRVEVGEDGKTATRLYVEMNVGVHASIGKDGDAIRFTARGAYWPSATMRCDESRLDLTGTTPAGETIALTNVPWLSLTGGTATIRLDFGFSLSTVRRD